MADTAQRPKRIRVQLAVKSKAAFLRTHGAAVSGGGIVLTMQSDLTEGREVHLVVIEKGGPVLFDAEGVVDSVLPGKLAIRFTKVSEESKALLLPPEEKTVTSAPPAPAPLIETLDLSPLVEPLPENFSERPAAFMYPPIEGKKSDRRIGIDLGTAYSCAGYVENGACQLIPADRGRVSFPSAVYVKGDNFLVGELAVQRIESHSSNVVHSWKRLLGRRFDSAAVQDVLAHVGYRVEAGPEGEAAVQMDELLCHPAWFAARVLYEIRLRAHEHLGEVVEEAVITVPAHYTDPQRADVRDAAKLAGFTAVRLITEPVAAAIAYGVGRGLDKTLLIYDFGGGTFDCSILEVEGSVFQVAATGGDPFLGGVDFDDRIMGSLLVDFRKKTGISLTGDPAALARVAAASERAKRDLSEKSTARVTLPFLARIEGKGVPLDAEITREQLEGLSRDLVARSLAACDETMKQAGITIDQVDEIVAVGGMSRMPLIQDQVKAHFGKNLRRGVNADEAVARGAALFADSLGRDGDMAILDVVSLAVGVIGADAEAFIPVIPTRAQLPATRTHVVLAERDDQTGFRLDVYQGNAVSIAYCDYLGTTAAEGLAPAKKGSVLTEVIFSMDEEGTIALALKPRAGPIRPLRLTVAAGRARPARLPGNAEDRGFTFLRKLLGGR